MRRLLNMGLQPVNFDAFLRLNSRRNNNKAMLAIVFGAHNLRTEDIMNTLHVSVWLLDTNDAFF